MDKKDLKSSKFYKKMRVFRWLNWPNPYTYPSHRAGGGAEDAGRRRDITAGSDLVHPVKLNLG
jgi:hypothetical protein